MVSVGDKVRITKDIPSINGMLRKGSVVRIDEITSTSSVVRGNIRVVDNLGKIWWVGMDSIDNK